MAKKQYEYLDQSGVQELSKGILAKVNRRINERIVQEINERSDNEHVPSALAVYRAIANEAHVKIIFITGDINELVPLEERQPNVQYYQRDNEQDTTWMIYVWDVENQQWVAVGDTEIDLSGYWSKDETGSLETELGVDTLKSEMAAAKTDILNLRQDVDTNASDIVDIKGDIDDINIALENKVEYDDINSITTQVIRTILDDAYNETDPFRYEDVATVTDIVDKLAEIVESEESEIALQISQNLDLESASTKTISIPSGVEAEINIPAGVEVSCVAKAFEVANGASLTLSGDGKITGTTKTSKSLVTVEPGGELTIDGITIDSVTGQDEGTNWSYGVYAKNTSTVNFVSGVIRSGSSAIATNNTTGGSVINITGGELYSDGGYAIYNAAQSTINITGGKIQGINARMGTINISGDAQIIPTDIDSTNYDDIGANIATSGSIYVGDTIALIAGSYNDANGIDIEVNVEGNATIESNFRAGIGVYMLDTNEAANVTINVEDGSKVTTTDVSSDNVKVYDHEFISAAATAAGKAYNPSVTSNVTLNIN